MQSWHATWASEGRHPIAPEETRRRALVRAIGRIAGDATSLFCVVDDHVHVVLYCPEAERGRYAQALTLAFRPLVATPLGRAYVRPVRDRGHLEWLADEYIFRQPVKHGLATHPALWSGSCFADLAGARVVPGLKLRLLDALPRWRLRNAHRALGLPEARIEGASDDAVRRAGPSRIVTAAAFASVADPTLRGRADPELLGRRVAVTLARAVDIGSAEIAWALGITNDAATRVAAREAPKDLVAAARVRLAIEEACTALPLRVREPEAPAYGDEPGAAE